ncbi:helix-turn-helix domain-containing protein [Metabacillus halosaccharovorans]|uniref:helix-turn-helix domain-containing protein n=1 Tax=Metabacillus halosaccharovorans TaxID=930124 RepID=UPI00203FC0E1|nr:helix-turn-helix domain-containing protein [Metabacillus halosaccharovorans]MCM3440257.1 AraC family transcriptional regulator [Metabacillus halosaccharovorans]
MNYPYESVVVNEEVPVFLLMTTVKYVAMHWHDRIEFLLVLKGKVHVYVGREDYTLHENDLLLINSNEGHGVESDEENTILIVQIPISFIKKCYKNIEQERFQCQSFLHENQQQFNKIRTLLAQLCLTVKQKKENYDLKVHSLLLDTIYHLVTDFKMKNQHELKQTSKKNIERMNRITDYIEKHYMHPLTLEELAETEQLTPPYLSRYFQQHMGQTFLKYLNGIRLEHALYSLLETDLPIIQIAMECGFTNLNTFHKLFKDTFHTTPHQYRKKQSTSFTTLRRKKEGVEGYEFVEENDIRYLYKYLEKDKNRYDFS